MLRRAISAAVLGTTLLALSHDASAQTPDAAPKAGTFTAAQFRGLRFLEGSWKGSGYAPGPFYERYRFVNDSTIDMSAWSDSTFTRMTETSTYEFRGGQIRKADGSSAVIHIDSLGYHFARLTGRPGAWTFRRVTADRWTATLGPSTVYTMDRIKR